VALPIVNSSGTLVGSLSASDLRSLKREEYVSLLTNAMTFLKNRAPEQKLEPVMCTLDESLSGVCKRILDKKVHRAWVVNNLSDRKVIGVVSLSDIIQKFSPALKNLHQGVSSGQFFDLTRFQRVYTRLVESGKTQGQALAEKASNIGGQLSNTAGKISDTASSITGRISGAVSGLAEKIQTQLEAKNNEKRQKMLMSLSLSNDFSTVCANLETSVPTHSMGIVAVHNLRESLAQKGVTLGHEAKVYEICNPKLAALMISTDPSVLTMLPCRVSVCQLEKEILVESLRPTALVELFNNEFMSKTAVTVEGYLMDVFKDLQSAK